MRIKLYATLRAAAGGKFIQVEPPAPPTVRGYLNAAVALKPALGPQLFDEQGQLRDHIQILLNGRQYEYLPNGLDTPVAAGDELDLFPPVGGGR